ncbi:MAG: hypothetical protein GEV08_17375 [Acidimicrobiia bacterium]|nr:hypothetical protein [Acidimicrobiia bacterium]
MDLVARVVEELGIPTVVVATGRDLTAQGAAASIPVRELPDGQQLRGRRRGRQQRCVLLAALRLAHEGPGPGVIADLDETWPVPFGDKVEATLPAM